MAAQCYLLDILPAEVISSVLQYVSQRDLIVFGSTSKRSYDYATDFTWRDLLLRDECWISSDQLEELQGRPPSDQLEELRSHASSAAGLPEDMAGGGTGLSLDCHDDTPIIKKLIILIKNPVLAGKVRTVTARCHLPGPDIFEELMTTSFSGQSVSSDWRTIELLRLAIRNMINVHTLRLCFPHYNLGRVLLNDFFHKSRPRNAPVRKLWLESCDLFCDNLYTENFDMSGLESIRVRRLKSFYFPMGNGENASHFCIARYGIVRPRLDGAGDTMFSWHRSPEQEDASRPRSIVHPDLKALPTRETTACTCPGSIIFDSHMYTAIPEATPVLESKQEVLMSLPPLNIDVGLEYETDFHYSSGIFSHESNDMHLTTMLQLPYESLKHLNLDWILAPVFPPDQVLARRQYRLLARLCTFRFSNLRSFQLRNAFSEECHLPLGVALLQNCDYTLPPTPAYMGATHLLEEAQYNICFLEFLENHPNLSCLAWPLQWFFTNEEVNPEIQKRVRQVITRLGNTLETLRIDAEFELLGEPQDGGKGNMRRDKKRQRFISEFAPYMRNLKTIKMEGGIPRDEKREILRALCRCPLERIIMIGRSFPLGNCWGGNAAAVREFEGTLFHDFADLFEPENEPVIEAARELKPQPPANENAEFYPAYGWDGQPMLFTIASLFASTITELKFCGVHGAPIYERPESSVHNDITPGILHHLRYFHNLKQLVISIYILRDERVNRSMMIDGWRAWQSIQGACEVEESIITIGPYDANPYSGTHMSHRLFLMMRPYLSPMVLKNGLDFRASFIVGEEHEDIFDLDMFVTEKGVVSAQGPRSLTDGKKWWTKLTERSYF